MAVTYVVVERGNPQKQEEPKKYYAQAKASGELTLKKLSKEIAQGSTTVSDTDVLAVLNDLTKILSRHLADGEIVRFGDFGAFQITLSGSGAASADYKGLAASEKGGWPLRSRRWLGGFGSRWLRAPQLGFDL